MRHNVVHFVLNAFFVAGIFDLGDCIFHIFDLRGFFDVIYNAKQGLIFYRKYTVRELSQLRTSEKTVLRTRNYIVVVRGEDAGGKLEHFGLQVGQHFRQGLGPEARPSPAAQGVDHEEGLRRVAVLDLDAQHVLEFVAQLGALLLVPVRPVVARARHVADLLRRVEQFAQFAAGQLVQHAFLCVDHD